LVRSELKVKLKEVNESLAEIEEYKAEYLGFNVQIEDAEVRAG
jgi:hypothetical protein